MRDLCESWFLVPAGFALIGVLLLGKVLLASPINYPQQTVINLARPCVMVAATAPTKMACTTGTDADSGALTKDEKILVNCKSDAWWRAGSAAVNAVADDTPLDGGVTYEFVTTAESFHFSCLSVAVNGACYVTRCQ